jgi:type I restriction enzyme S subunit
MRTEWKTNPSESHPGVDMKQGWVYKKLGEVCDTGAGGTPLKAHKEYYEGGTIPWLLSGDVNQGEIFKVSHSITEKGLKNSSAKLFPKNTVLVAMYGATAGRVGLLRCPSTTNQAICGIFPNDKFIPEFLYYFFQSKEKELAGQSVGNAQPNISQVMIKNTLVPCVHIQEQQRIVAILDEAFAAIDAAKANAEKNLQNSRELFETYLNNIFANPGEGWVDKKLGDICENLDFKRVPVTKRDRYKGQYPYYGASGIVDYVNDFLFDEDLLLVSEDGANLLARTYPIAFSITGKAWVNNHAHVLKFAAIETQKYVEYFLNSIKVDEYVNGMAQPKLNQKMLNSITIHLPELCIQKSIICKFNTLYVETKKQEAIYQQKMDNLEELKKSLLQKAFNGELTEG